MNKYGDPAVGSRRVRYWSAVRIQLWRCFKEHTQPYAPQHLVRTWVDRQEIYSNISVLCASKPRPLIKQR
jgi:hypothetical protein